MKTLIYYYLCVYNILDYVLIFMLGGESGVGESSFHPGILIRGVITILLLVDYFVGEKFGLYYKIFGFLFIFMMLVFYPIHSFYMYSKWGFFFELQQSFKILFIILLVHFVAKNRDYFSAKLSNIMLINVAVISFNLYASFFLNFGRTSMYTDSDFSKGYLSGNAQSVYTFVFFAYFLFNYSKSILYKFSFWMNLVNFYILGTKGVYFVLPILIFYIYDRLKKSLLYSLVLVLFCALLSGAIFATPLKNSITAIYKNRIGYHFEKEREKLLTTGKQYEGQAGLSTLEDITAGGRLYRAVEQVGRIISGGVYNKFFGFGATGQKRMYDMPAKMDVVDILFRYGFFGLVIIYGIIISIVARITVLRETSFCAVIVVCIFAYSSLGGFVINAAGVASIFGLFLGLQYSKHVDSNSNCYENFDCLQR